MNHEASRRAVSTVVAFAAVAALSVHCSSGGSGSLSDGGLDTVDGSHVNPVGCPTSQPAANSNCSLPSGTVCTATETPNCQCCSAPTYTCTNGKWSIQSGGGPPSGGGGISSCPPSVPADGSPCTRDPCRGADPAPCTYSCATGNGYEGFAQCTGGAWRVTASMTACAFDAGTDAKSDARIDASGD